MSLSTFWTTLMMPNKLAMGQLARDVKSLVRMHFLYSALDAGLLAALDRERTREELLDMLEVRRPELLDAMLDLGRALGELALSDGMYRLKGRLSSALADPANDGLAAMVQGQVTYYNTVFRDLAARLRGGELSDDLARIGELVARISTLTEPFMAGFIGGLVRGPARILDIGCGVGAHLQRCASLSAEASGRGLELDPEVASAARRNLEAWGIADRFDVVEGDIREPPGDLGGDFDVAMVFSMVYYFPVEERTALFRTIRDRLAPGGRLAVASTVRGKDDVWAANLDTATRSMSGCASLPALDELQRQLLDAGFERLDTARLMPRSSFYGLVAS